MIVPFGSYGSRYLEAMFYKHLAPNGAKSDAASAHL